MFVVDSRVQLSFSYVAGLFGGVLKFALYASEGVSLKSIEVVARSNLAWNASVAELLNFRS